MIDLLSTRNNVDDQTRACARLLAAVIAQAVQDAATPFSVFKGKDDKPIYESKVKRNLNREARLAIRWLFFPDSLFPGYASLIGLNAQAIRDNLLSHRYETSKMLTTEQRRIITMRLQFERMDTQPVEESYDADGLEQEPEGPGGNEIPGERGAGMAGKGAANSPRVPKSLRK